MNNHGIYIDRHPGTVFLNGSWEYAFFDTEMCLDQVEYRYQTMLPASAYKSVYESRLLPHYYVDDNSRLYRELQNKVFYYRRSFQLNISLKEKQAFLCFDGADYKIKVFLNGTDLGTHIGIAGGPYINVTKILRFDQENEIVIEAKSPTYGIKDFDAWNHNDKSTVVIPWGFAADSECSNGNFCVHGITGDVRIEFVPEVHLSRPFLFTKKISTNSAVLHLSVELTRADFDETAMNRGYAEDFFFIFPTNGGCKIVPARKTYQIKLCLSDGNGVTAEKWFKIPEIDFEKSFIREDRRETQYIEKDIVVKNPVLWYPCNMGQPHLYTVELSLYDGSEMLDQHCFKFGIRTVENINTEADKLFFDLPKYQFVVNGKKQFLRGVNMMPQDFLLDCTPEKYRQTLRLVRQANIGFVRLWGAAGNYETDTFYEICNEYGILVWQDSMIANMNTPSWDVRILDSMVSANVYRIRKYSSLAVYCGGNEFNPYNTGNAATLGRIRQTINLLDNTRPFFETTALGGSAHVYNDMEANCYRKLYRDLPFMGESGIHCFPAYQSLSEVVDCTELSGACQGLSLAYQKTHPKLMCHFVENHPDRIPRMLIRASQVKQIQDSTIRDLCLSTQMASFEFYQFMCEALQENYPRTAGLLPWVFSRPWTTIGVQLVDGALTPTLAYYAVKKAYSDLSAMVCLQELAFYPGERIAMRACILNHRKQRYENIRLRLRIYSPELRLAYEEEQIVTSETYKHVVIFPSFVVPNAYTDKAFFLMVHMTGESVDYHQYYRPKCLHELADKAFRMQFRSKLEANLDFSGRLALFDQVKAFQTKLDVKSVESRDAGVTIMVKNAGPFPAIPVYITGAVSPFCPSDNGFMLEPDETRQIRIEAPQLPASICLEGFNFETCHIKIAASDRVG